MNDICKICIILALIAQCLSQAPAQAQTRGASLVPKKGQTAERLGEQEEAPQYGPWMDLGGLVTGLYTGGFDFRLGPGTYLGPQGMALRFQLGDFSMQGGGIGVQWTQYLGGGGKRSDSGWTLSASAAYLKIYFQDQSSGSDLTVGGRGDFFSGDTDAFAGHLGFGYQWSFDHFFVRPLASVVALSFARSVDLTDGPLVDTISRF